MVASKAREKRADQSVYVGVSTSIRDAIGARKNKGRAISAQESEVLYECNNFASNAIDYPVDAATSGDDWFHYKCDNPDLSEYIGDRIQGTKKYFNEALKIARITGGSAIFLGVKDGRLPDQPINFSAIQEVEFFNVLEGGLEGELRISEINSDPTSEGFGMPLYYQLGTQKFHADRMLPFYGIKPLTKRRKALYGHWGIPILSRAIDKLEKLEIADSSIAATLPNFSRLIYEIEGLAASLATASGRAKLRARVEEITYCWQALGILPVEAGKESIKNISYDYSGLKELLTHFKIQLSGSLDIPHTKLFGESPSGVTSGTSEQEDWQDFIHDYKDSELRSPLLRLARLFAAEIVNPYRGAVENEELSFPKRNRITPKEQSEIDFKNAQTAHIYKTDGVLTPEGIAESLQKGLPLSSAVDMEAIKADQELARQMIENNPLLDPDNTDPDPTMSDG